MLKPVLENPWVQAMGLVLALGLVAALAYLLSFVLVPLLLAFLVAYVLDPVVDFFEARKVSRGVTIATLAVLGIVLVLSIPMVLVPRVFSEAYQLVEESRAVGLEAEEERAENPLYVWTDKAVAALPIEDFARQMGWGDPRNEQEARAILAERVGEGVIAYLKAHAGQFALSGQATGTTLAQFFGSIGRGIVATLLFLGNFALFAFVAGYLLRDFDGLVAAATELVPPKYRSKTADVVGKIDIQVRGFVRGQLTVCVCLGVMYAGGLLVSGTPFAIPIALFGAAASFVP